MTFEERAEFLFQSIESHDRQIGENAFHIAQLRESIEKLVAESNRDARGILALARIAEAHESRISNQEENR